MAENESKLGNFKKALNELINGEPTAAPIQNNEKEIQLKLNNNEIKQVTEQEGNVALEPEVLQSSAHTAGSEAAPGPKSNLTMVDFSKTNPAPPKPNSKTVIAHDVEIIGDIKAQGDIDIRGEIKGNIYSEGHVMLAGAVSGSIMADSADLESGFLNGEALQVQTHIDIKEGFEINSEIQARSIDINGKVHGNITVTEDIVLYENADVAGNVMAQNISVQKGAVINGNIKIGQE